MHCFFTVLVFHKIPKKMPAGKTDIIAKNYIR